MHLDETRITVSLATVEFSRAGSGTRLKFTEQMVMLDGSDDVSSRIRGTEELLDSLGASFSPNEEGDRTPAMARREQTPQLGPMRSACSRAFLVNDAARSNSARASR